MARPCSRSPIRRAARPPRPTRRGSAAPAVVPADREAGHPVGPARARRAHRHEPGVRSGGQPAGGFTCDGAGVSPPVEWQAGPPGTSRLRARALARGARSREVLLGRPRHSGDRHLTSRRARGRSARRGSTTSSGPSTTRCARRARVPKKYHITVYALSAVPRSARGRRDPRCAARRDRGHDARGGHAHVHLRTRRAQRETLATFGACFLVLACCTAPARPAPRRPPHVRRT